MCVCAEHRTLLLSVTPASCCLLCWTPTSDTTLSVSHPITISAVFCLHCDRACPIGMGWAGMLLSCCALPWLAALCIIIPQQSTFFAFRATAAISQPAGVVHLLSATTTAMAAYKAYTCTCYSWLPACGAGKAQGGVGGPRPASTQRMGYLIGLMVGSA